MTPEIMYVAWALLQAPSGIWNVQGSVTVVGVLLVALAALYLGLVTPKHTVEEMRVRLKEREAENDTLHKELMRASEEKAELRGEMTALRRELEEQRREIEALRDEVRELRRDTGRSVG